MPIEFACACGRRMTVADEHAGKRVRCPECRSVCEVPPAATPGDLPAILARLEAAERENAALRRRQGRLVTGGLIGMAASALLAASPGVVALARRPAATAPAHGPDYIEQLAVGEIVLRDSRGGTKGGLGVGPDGSAFVMLGRPDSEHFILLASEPGGQDVLEFHREGKVRSSLGVNGEGPRLALLDDAEKIRMDVTVKPDGWARLNVFGEEDRGGVNLSAHGAKGANIGVFSPSDLPSNPQMRATRFGVQLDSKNDVNMMLTGEAAEGGILFSVDAAGNPSGAAIDGDGNPVKLSAR